MIYESSLNARKFMFPLDYVCVCVCVVGAGRKRLIQVILSISVCV